MMGRRGGRRGGGICVVPRSKPNPDPACEEASRPVRRSLDRWEKRDDGGREISDAQIQRDPPSRPLLLRHWAFFLICLQPGPTLLSPILHPTILRRVLRVHRGQTIAKQDTQCVPVRMGCDPACINALPSSPTLFAERGVLALLRDLIDRKQQQGREGEALSRWRRHRPGRCWRWLAFADDGVGVGRGRPGCVHPVPHLHHVASAIRMPYTTQHRPEPKVRCRRCPSVRPPARTGSGSALLCVFLPCRLTAPLAIHPSPLTPSLADHRPLLVSRAHIKEAIPPLTEHCSSEFPVNIRPG